jgi:hypothetical protein
MTDDLQSDIERLIDTHGLYRVIHELERICYGKAEHLASNWQDHDASRRWEKAGKVFDRTHTALEKIQWTD